MEKPLNPRNLFLLIPVLLIPILGSFALGCILIMAIFLNFYLVIKKNRNDASTPYRTLGLIFISYFAYYTGQGFFYSSNLTQHIHDIGKIVPILIIGILALFLKTDTFKVNYKILSLVATLSIYLTTILAFSFRYFSPDIIILGQTFTEKTGVLGRLEMGTGNALPFATIFITFAFLTCVGYERKSIFEKLISFAALILAIAVVGFWNLSRGPLLLVAPLTLLMLWYLFKNSRSEKTWWPLILGFFIIILLPICFVILQGLLGNHLSVHLVNGLQQLTFSGGYDNSVSIRLNLYQAGLQAFFVNPIFGFGIGNLLESIHQFLPKDTHLAYSHLHNMFLNHMIAGGVVGLLFLLLLTFSPILLLWQKRNIVSLNGIYLSLLIVITIFGAGMSNVLFFHDLLSGFFTVIILLAAIAANTEDN